MVNHSFDHFIGGPTNLQGTVPSVMVFARFAILGCAYGRPPIGECLGLGRGNEEQGTQLTEPLKVRTTILLQLMFYCFEVV